MINKCRHFVFIIRGYYMQNIDESLYSESGDFFTGLVYINDMYKLMWTKNGRIVRNEMTWADTTEWLNNLDYGGYTNWRIPTYQEFNQLIEKFKFPRLVDGQLVHRFTRSLFEIFDEENGEQVNIANLLNKSGFEHIINSVYWCIYNENDAELLLTESEKEDSKRGIIDISTCCGNAYNRRDECSFYIWPVRDIIDLGEIRNLEDIIEREVQNKADLEITNNALIYTDQRTGLTWTRNANLSGVRMDWREARRYVTDLNYAGYRDWILPTRCELTSLLNENGLFAVELNAKGFNNVQGGVYWTIEDDGETAWAEEIYHYPADLFDVEGPYCDRPLSKKDRYYVWPVRGGMWWSVM